MGTVHSSQVIEKALSIDNSEEEGEEEHNMNYIRSRFLNKDRNVQRANPFNDADYALRDYRQRRRHRKELANLMDNVCPENGENNIHLTSEHHNNIESVVPVETAEP